MNAIHFFANKDDSEMDDSRDVGHRLTKAHLFELQIGLIDIGNAQAVWVGSLQNVNNGEKRFFKSWSGLAANLQDMLTPSAQLEVLKALIRLKQA
jgi:hypothetical protein